MLYIKCTSCSKGVRSRFLIPDLLKDVGMAITAQSMQLNQPEPGNGKCPRTGLHFSFWKKLFHVFSCQPSKFRSEGQEGIQTLLLTSGEWSEHLPRSRAGLLSIPSLRRLKLSSLFCLESSMIISRQAWATKDLELQNG